MSFKIFFAPKAKKQISKLDEVTKHAIKDYLETKMSISENIKELYKIGGTELVGNLKGLWRFKDTSFKKYRIIAYIDDRALCITILSVESRNDSYKNKENLPKKARNGIF